MEDIIACIALLLLPPHLEVALLATARCGPIRIFEGGPSLDSSVRVKIPTPPLSITTRKTVTKYSPFIHAVYPPKIDPPKTNPFQFSI